MVDSLAPMDYPVYMACRQPLGHLAVMDVMAPKETWAARGRLDPRVCLVLKERKEQRENMESRVLPVKKESEGKRAIVELPIWLHT